MTIDDFFRRIDGDKLTTVERALALLWWVGREDPAAGLRAREVCEILERNGHPKQNASRLQTNLEKSRATAKAGTDCWRLHPRSRKDLGKTFSGVATARAVPVASDSVLPRELFDSTRGYLERVVHQLNASYDNGLFDCCTVMCRRALETLLIEVYEAAGRANEVKDADGHFFMFSGLLSHFEKDSSYHPGRNALKGLRDFKALGDLSAHNRRFNARKDDIDRVRDGLRVAAEELLNLAGLASSQVGRAA
jgi:hypothetical protein